MREYFFYLLIAIGIIFLSVKIFPASSVEDIISTKSEDLALELSENSLQLGSPIFIRIFKASSELELWIKQNEKFTLFNTYPICYFSGKLGPKLKQGDKQSPEGFYYVPPSMMNPNSRFHLSFNLGYPNTYDRFHKRTGDFLMVHGNCVSIGCYAMTDELIEEIYTLASAAFDNGQSFFRVHAFPFRMTEKNMRKHKGHEWFDFWENLKEGYDYFEDKKIPPNVEVEGGRYVFED